ncbi:hypothetical protein [Medusavirus stheno T3]|uniref:Uncharacterized protein n=1 Tax=Medusavirus stheno T3 TaxID=3069717 RepID=A0A7S7YFY4_9VIRU|nr:hypothetical protein QKU73_gp335 [Acanthamoeba castellanii medusavirus]QPB44440.1 hypothetical protein [Medusavirus stheno T3]
MSSERNMRVTHAYHQIMRYALARKRSRKHNIKLLHFLSLPATQIILKNDVAEKLGASPADVLLELVQRLRNAVDDVIHEEGFVSAYVMSHAMDAVLLRSWRRHFPEGEIPITGHVNRRRDEIVEAATAKKTKRAREMCEMWESGAYWNY